MRHYIKTEGQTEITEEEYRVMEKVFARLGCGELIKHGHTIGTVFYEAPISSFLTHQPEVVRELSGMAGKKRGDESTVMEAWHIDGFVSALPDINRLLCDFTENKRLLCEADTICEALHKAEQKYYKPAAAQRTTNNGNQVI